MRSKCGSAAPRKPRSSGAASYICGEAACGVVGMKCDVEAEGSDPLCGTGKLISFDEAALNCALDQLIAGTPGLVEYHELSEGFGSSSFAGGFIVVGDGLTRRFNGYDANYNETAAGFVALKDAAYFKSCKAEVELSARYACFKAWSDAEPGAACDDTQELSEQF